MRTLGVRSSAYNGIAPENISQAQFVLSQSFCSISHKQRLF